MRIWRIILPVFLLSAVACGCLHPAPRQPVTINNLQAAETKFGQIAGGLLETWNSRDTQVVKDLFTDDAEAYDRSFGDHVVGPDQITGLIAIVSAFGPNWEARQTDRYIGLDNGLVVDEMWNLKFGSIQFTQDHPMMDIDWLQTRNDRISNWTILYGLDTLEELAIPSLQRLDQARSLLSSYQAAWSSGKVQAVTQLYANDAVREDMVFMERQEGQRAITTFAKSFFGWYPGAQWNISLEFGEGIGDAPITGGLYTIKVNDQNGQPCEVKMAILLQTAENLIIQETLYYEAQSLISCGWAR
jgi:ketosteroid isomerase-like protein